MNTFANQQVLEFYQALPFNYYGSLEEQLQAVKNNQPIGTIYPPLKDLISHKRNILDIGCGAGWLSNTIAYQHQVPITGIDFNPVAIERAKMVSEKMKLKSNFVVCDLFQYDKQVNDKFDLIISLGVLHHTNNCLEAIKYICRELLTQGGYFLVGLYHQYGREAFLKYFKDLKISGLSEEQLFARYKELHPLSDETHLRSWFRDQVLHPHETQHTLAEIIAMLKDIRCALVSTSINKFQGIESLEKLVEEEKKYYELSLLRLQEKKYFPGFFLFLLRKG